jgi:hypothetical protein
MIVTVCIVMASDGNLTCPSILLREGRHEIRGCRLPGQRALPHSISKSVDLLGHVIPGSCGGIGSGTYRVGSIESPHAPQPAVVREGPVGG